MRYIGLDFGTTNSSLAHCGGAGEAPSLVRFGARQTTTFRSVAHFEEAREGGRAVLATRAGPDAIDHYLQGGAGRLIQSLKSYLASPLFTATSVYGRTWTLEDLVTLILRTIREGAAAELGPGPLRGAVVGRPVRFANADGEADEALALRRLTEALGRAGFEDVRFEYEPVGAACFYELSLDHDELVLIGDFGGGTSDFCLMRVGPGQRGVAGRDRILGTEGVGLAGDVFDSEVVEAVVSPRLGKGSEYRAFMEGRVMTVPPWIFQKLRRWHHLSFLKSRETMAFLRDLRAQSLAPDRIDALIHLVDDDLGYPLYRAVEGAKQRLSRDESTPFEFVDLPVDLRDTILRRDFEAWIARPLDAIRGCVDRLLAATGVGPGEVDRVFLTGGSSLVPAVRRVFAERFGEAKLRGGDELTSVAQGLSLRAALG
ncbi:MAG: Hsp70 family protein [Polyangiales bacterium]